LSSAVPVGFRQGTGAREGVEVIANEAREEGGAPIERDADRLGREGHTRLDEPGLGMAGARAYGS
jgi:hypothetical protein